MKLLFDQNLSPKLIPVLTDVFPGSIHVQNVNLDKAQDNEVWEYARNNNYVIVSKDIDFSERSLIYGFPPKIIWIRRGNCTTKQLEEILRSHFEDVKNLYFDTATGVLSLF